MAAVQHQVSAFEDRYAHEQDVKFKINARRNALLGLWAASIMKNAEADAYAQELMEMSVINPTGVFDRVSKDFEAAGVAGLQDEIHNRMRDLLQSAAQELQQNR
jgi:hypothetical protein